MRKRDDDKNKIKIQDVFWWPVWLSAKFLSRNKEIK